MNDMKINDDLTLVQKYWDQEKTRIWRQYYVDKNNQKQGEYKYLHEDGRIDTIRNYKDGELHGNFQEWWLGGRRWYIETHHFKKEYHGIKIEFKYEK